MVVGDVYLGMSSEKGSTTVNPEENVTVDKRKAGFWVRLAATWIDLLIIYLILKAGIMVLEQFGVFDHFEIVVFALMLAYAAMFIGGKGRTVGKMLCGLTVRRKNGKPVGYLREILREIIGKLIAGVFLCLGFFWAGFFRSKRGWHDHIARTVVKQNVRAIKRGRILLALVLVTTVSFVSLKGGVFLVEYRDLQARNVLKAGAVDVSSLTEADHEPFVAYLGEHGTTPVKYVVDKFKRHDVVILGEPHRIREVCEFVSELIHPLYHQSGVRILAMEVFKYKNTALANQLVTGKTYDEELALSLLRDCGWPEWGFQEYIDILKAVWQVNKDLPPDAEKFRVVCLDSDWDGSALRTGRQLWKLPGIFWRMFTRDEFMAKVFEREVLQKGEKALAHVGAHHDFTHYRQPVVRKGELIAEVSPRFGCILHDKYDDRVFQVALHRWHGPPETVTRGENVPFQQPFGGLLEEVFAKNDNTPVGFDVNGSPFALLRDDKSYYFAFQNHVTFSDIARGYVFLKPLNELNNVTWAKGFVNERNFDTLKDFLQKRGKIRGNECSTYEELNKALERWHNEERIKGQE